MVSSLVSGWLCRHGFGAKSGIRPYHGDNWPSVFYVFGEWAFINVMPVHSVLLSSKTEIYLITSLNNASSLKLTDIAIFQGRRWSHKIITYWRFVTWFEPSCKLITNYCSDSSLFLLPGFLYVCFLFEGTAGLLWCVAWFLLAANRPSTHPRIEEEEKEFIESSLRNERKSEVSWTYKNWKWIKTMYQYRTCITSYIRYWFAELSVSNSWTENPIRYILIISRQPIKLRRSCADCYLTNSVVHNFFSLIQSSSLGNEHCITW